jgi:hypothetical protein
LASFKSFISGSSFASETLVSYSSSQKSGEATGEGVILWPAVRQAHSSQNEDGVSEAHFLEQKKNV